MAETFNLNAVFALTGGPKQPDNEGFAAIEMSDMVDPFTGDFTYNIPLFDIGGYPMNLVYNSGISMDQEASWVGLGWTITPGVVNRDMRSLPDDFNGDIIRKEFNIKNNSTYTVTGGGKVEIVGLGLATSMGVTYNNYTKYDVDFCVNPSLNLTKSNGLGLTAGLGISASSSKGAGISPSVGISYQMSKSTEGDKSVTGGASASVGCSYNTRSGLQALTINTGMNVGTKKGKESTGSKDFGASTAYSFVTPTYTPQISMPMENVSFSFTGTLGGEVYPVHLCGTFSGSYANQSLVSNYKSSPAFGYMYSQNNYIYGGLSMLDFNREKDGVYFKNVPNLPITNFTFDVFSVTGQGISGTYRPRRSDVGIIFDDQVSNSASSDLSLGVEVGLGNTFHAGASIIVNNVNSKSGQWRTNWVFKEKFKFRNGIYGYDESELYEPFYFKQAGEKTVESDPYFFNNVIRGYDPVFIPISKFGIINDPWLNNKDTRNFRINRDRRNQTITMLNASEASKWGIDKDIISHPENIFTFDPELALYKDEYDNRIVRNTGNRKGHHISEITTYKTDGSRYIYGIPAYNNLQEEVTFAVNANNANNDYTRATGLIPYSKGVDNSCANTQGQDNYYNKNIMYGYSHSFLLTEILSSDYVDADEIEGPSIGDLGNYTKFNYTKLHNDYNWRVPFMDANYYEGMKSRNDDDKASYIYGKKEIWYLHSIETKTQVAEFVLGRRDDSYGVNDENGGLGNSYDLRKLIAIKIYSLQDKKQHGNDAIPIKTIHFEYYEDAASQLCPGIENNIKNNSETKNNGKLTLKRVYFTYGKSEKSKLNTYVFKYGEYCTKSGKDLIVNPSYNIKGYDRWGVYKPLEDEINPTGLKSYEFPYTPQDLIPQGNAYHDATGWRKYMADKYATAWNLTSIKLPSGGLIKVDYEADDYAYVQNKRAMRMFKVANPKGNNFLYSKNSIYTRIYFELEEQYPNDSDLYKDQFKKDYLTDENGKSLIGSDKEMYFRFNVNMYNIDIDKGAYEYVSGYSPIINGGFEVIKGLQYGYVDIKIFADEEGDNYNPIAVSAWNFAKLNLPDIAFNKEDQDGNGVLAIAKAMVTALSSIQEFFESFYSICHDKNFCNTFNPSKSWIRLYEPDGVKKGGGVRVKRLVINDQWNEMTGSEAYESYDFGQEYDYTTVNAYGDTISSGVAAYEPQIGGDENPWKMPISYEYEKKLAPNDKFYIETPMGESFFPAATVGYSKVAIKNLQYNNVTRNASGKIVYEFYTSKDFPTITAETGLASVRDKSSPLRKFLKFKVHDYMTVSQGYVIELNDMHGKPKAQWVYQEGQANPMTGVEYKYNNLNNKLNNEVNVIAKDGTISKETVGIDYDFTIDMREQSTKNTSSGVNLNLDFFIVGIIPIPILIPLPQRNTEKVRFRSVVTTKVINRTGLLNETIAYDEGAKVSTENLLYDAETGEVILTSATNQYSEPLSVKKDKLYSFTYPAHWGYDALASVYKTAGATLNGSSSRFKDGDIVSVSNSAKKGWITSTSNGALKQVVDSMGVPISFESTSSVKVIKSGRKNQQAMPIGTVISTENPIQTGSLYFDPEKVLDASAIEYTDSAKIFCECNIISSNPFVNGLRGNWKPKRSFVYMADRKQTLSNNNTNIRYDGIFTRFDEFWTSPNGNYDWNKNYDNWTFASEVTLYNPYGGELENRDALGIYSSAGFGYNYTLPIYITKNAQYTQSGFDNFEDYKMDKCTINHFNFEEEGSGNVTESQSHTGRNSIEVGSGKTVKVVRYLKGCPNEQ
ncbi:MAG: hypothetical protein JXQ69_00995 [Paludibacteraceae bacterium]|nr:hypothetical protein [Paludibacteraceae bacterium]